ncbi:MAG TPA: universal stress protein [Vicinamibacteria bacterium]|nr:universal stress protein [Vicinamibacteria bacterium]
MTSASIDRILCPTDFSVFSSQALRHAMALARTFHSRLLVVHVIPGGVPGVDTVYGGAPWLLAPEDRGRVEEEMRRFLEPAREARVDHETEVREGEPWREIVSAAAELGADLVVMGTHGRGGFEHLVLGSVAEKLVRRLPCPVLTVSHEEARTWAAPGLITRILCATDFSEMSAEALRAALAFAEKHRAPITLLHVVEELPDRNAAAHRALLNLEGLRADLQGRATERLRRIIADVAAPHVAFETRVVAGCAYKEILRAAAEERADLVVIGAQGHGVLDHLLSGSNAQHVIRAATCPVLTVRPAGARPPAHDSRRASLSLAMTT